MGVIEVCCFGFPDKMQHAVAKLPVRENIKLLYRRYAGFVLRVSIVFRRQTYAVQL
jgi:hypothetical protein